MKADRRIEESGQWRCSQSGSKVLFCGIFMLVGGCAAVAVGGVVLAGDRTLWPVDAYVLYSGEASLGAALAAFLVAAWFYLYGRDFAGLLKAAIGAMLSLAAIVGLMQLDSWFPYGWIPH